MTPETKAAIIYFSLFLLVGSGMIIHGFNLKRRKLNSSNNNSESIANNGPLLIVVGALMILWQAYELYEKLV